MASLRDIGLFCLMEWKSRAAISRKAAKPAKKKLRQFYNTIFE
jgi:hypothetical protein